MNSLNFQMSERIKCSIVVSYFKCFWSLDNKNPTGRE